MAGGARGKLGNTLLVQQILSARHLIDASRPERPLSNASLEREAEGTELVGNSVRKKNNPVRATGKERVVPTGSREKRKRKERHTKAARLNEKAHRNDRHSKRTKQKSNAFNCQDTRC